MKTFKDCLMVEEEINLKMPPVRSYTQKAKLIVEDIPTAVDYLASELFKRKKTLTPVFYKKLHKIMMTGDDAKCQKALDRLKSMNESVKTPEEILRSHGFKIKLVAPTKFGTQVDFAKKYEEEDIKKVLNKFTLKFDGKSIFIID